MMLSLKCNNRICFKPSKQKTIFKPCQATQVNVDWKDRARLVELSAGRTATLGMVIGTAISNIQQISFLTQLKTEPFFIILTSSIIACTTIIPKFKTGITKKEIGEELKIARLAMVFMTILFSIEIL